MNTHNCPKLITKEECIEREMCGWNDTTGKCRKKSIRKMKDKAEVQKKSKLTEVKCPNFTLQKECITNESCGWNDITNKCRKKSIRKLKNPKPKEIKCPNFTLQKDCITNKSCDWNNITNKCRKKSIRKLKDIAEKAEKAEPHRTKPEQGSNGIHIGDTIIDRISGPISIYYLTPSKQVSAENLLFFPSIVLFGDEHFSKTNVCERCNCTKGKGACCYTITDTPFLQCIDTLASKYPIDFYTETAFLGSNVGFKGGFMETFTSGDFVSCYHKTLRNTSFDKCPTKYIRWHAADSRHMDIQVDLDKGVHFPDPITKKLLNKSKLKISEKYMNTSYIEPQISYIIQHLSPIIKSTLDNNTFAKSYYISKLSKYIRQTVFTTIDKFVHFLQTAVDNNRFDINKLTNGIFSMMNMNNSIIYKQIAKQTFEPFKQISYWENLFNTTLDQNDTLKQKISTIKMPSFIVMLQLILGTHNFTESQLNIEILNHLNDLFEVLNSYRHLFFLDLYMITRMLKQPDGGRRSYLSFGYFGNYHVKNIQNLLVATGYYVVDKMRHGPHVIGNPSRCIDIDFSIDLNNELKRREQI
jgi:hypothetical protein